MYRSHGTKGSNRDYWSPAYASVFPLIKQSLALRLALAPYLYTAARSAHDTGVAAVHSLYLDWPGEEGAYAQPQTSFMHGRDILVRPVAAEVAGGSPTVDVWLPPSPTGWVAWADAKYTSASAAGATVQAPAALGQLPMFVRGGSVIPLLPEGALVSAALFAAPSLRTADTPTLRAGRHGRGTRRRRGLGGVPRAGGRAVRPLGRERQPLFRRAGLDGVRGRERSLRDAGLLVRGGRKPADGDHRGRGGERRLRAAGDEGAALD